MFKIGDIVMRRPGTLGATGAHGVVERVVDYADYYEDSTGQMVTVRFETRTETFIADTYVLVSR